MITMQEFLLELLILGVATPDEQARAAERIRELELEVDRLRSARSAGNTGASGEVGEA